MVQWYPWWHTSLLFRPLFFIEAFRLTGLKAPTNQPTFVISMSMNLSYRTTPPFYWNCSLAISMSMDSSHWTTLLFKTLWLFFFLFVFLVWSQKSGSIVASVLRLQLLYIGLCLAQEFAWKCRHGGTRQQRVKTSISCEGLVYNQHSSGIKASLTQPVPLWES